MLQLTKQSPQASPRGFTLVELMVTMVIISLLASILFVTIGRSVGQAKERATKATLKKVHEMLNQRREEFLLATLDNKILPHKRTVQSLGDVAADTIYARKIWAKGIFPQRFEDLVGADGVPGALDGRRTNAIDDDGVNGTDFNGARTDVGELGYSASNSDDAGLAVILREKIATGVVDLSTHTMGTESSELLYLALTESTSFGSTVVDAGEFRSAELADTDGDGLLEIIDGWGNPIRFYRWPTSLVRPWVSGTTPLETDTTEPDYRPFAANVAAYPNGDVWSLVSGIPLDSAMAAQDPDDPLGKLMNARNLGVERDGVTTSKFHEGSNTGYGGSASNNLPELTFHSPSTFHTLLLVSCGYDGELGINEAPDFANWGHLAQPTAATLANPNESTMVDNITNLNMGGL